MKTECDNFEQCDLVSDVKCIAKNTDPKLVNPWGILLDCEDESIWVANHMTGKLTNYNYNGTPNQYAVTVPTNFVTGTPTGIVFNETEKFKVTNGPLTKPSAIIGVTKDGIIYGYNCQIDSSSAIVIVNSPNKVFKGIDIVRHNLFVTDFSGGVIEKYDCSFNLVLSFTDPVLTAQNYAPFNVINVNNYLFVSFALQSMPNKIVDVHGTGNGYIDIFDCNGDLIKRFINRGALNSPWAMVAGYMKCKHVLYVGNAGDGMINIYDLKTGEYIGPLLDKNNNEIQIDGLWGLVPKHMNQHNIKFFFTAGINYYNNGLLGSLSQ